MGTDYIQEKESWIDLMQIFKTWLEAMTGHSTIATGLWHEHCYGNIPLYRKTINELSVPFRSKSKATDIETIRKVYFYG